jgi:hypothetical protein
MTLFTYPRRKPVNVLTVEVGFNLVEVGGKRLDTLREDFFDQGAGAFCRTTPPAIVSAYDIALSGGEPYSVWK